MVTNLIASGEFAVWVKVCMMDGFSKQLAFLTQLTFMDAADYAVNAQGYFTCAILDHTEWSSVQIEIGNRNGTIQLIEIKREQITLDDCGTGKFGS